MTHQPLLHEALKRILSSMSFPVNYLTAVDNGDGTYTLGGIQNIHHLQPEFTVTIGAQDFEVADYNAGDCTWNVVLKKGNNTLPSAPGSFNIPGPFFFHGTPAQQQAELVKIKLPKDKLPMLYIMEPYEPQEDYSPQSSIECRYQATLCFLTESNITQNVTDEFYHKAIHPMNRFRKEFFKKLIDSRLFFTDQLKVKPKYHTKFAIYVPKPRTQELYFSENMSGVSCEVALDLYRIESCDCPAIGAGDGDFNDDYGNDLYN